MITELILTAVTSFVVGSMVGMIQTSALIVEKDKHERGAE